MEKRGSYYSYQGENIAQGRENAKRYLREHPEVAEAIETAIREIAFGAPPEEPEEEE